MMRQTVFVMLATIEPDADQGFALAFRTTDN
jgi:hypothetical protein